MSDEPRTAATISAAATAGAAGAAGAAAEAADPRAEVLAMLATYGERSPEEVPETVDSLELAWLIHQIEQRHGRPFDADDDALARMTTVGAVVEVLAELGFGAAA